MARTMGVSSKWGAFLDSTLDRFGDAAVFSGLAIWFFRDGDNLLLAYVALWVLVMGSVTSYARARAESLGMVAKVGIAERSDRLVSVLLLTGLSGIFDWPILIAIALWALAVATHRHRRPTHGRRSPTGSRRPDVAVLNARRQPRDRAVDLAFRSAWAATRWVPERLSGRSFQAVADRVWRKRGPGVLQLEANLRRAAPEARRRRRPGTVARRAPFVLSLLERGIPAAHAAVAARRRRRRHVGGGAAPSSVRPGRRCDHRAAAHGQLGSRRSVGVRDGNAGVDGRRAAST